MVNVETTNYDLHNNANLWNGPESQTVNYLLFTVVVFLLKVLPEKLFSWQNYYQPFLWTISITKELDIHLIIQAQFESQLTHSAEANS